MADADVVGTFLKPFDKWQFRSILIIFLVKIPSSWFMACLIFTAKSPTPGEVFCSPPANLVINDTDRWIESAHVINMFSRIENEEHYDLCNISEVADQRYLGNLTVFGGYRTCDKFEHRPTFYSLIHQYDLFCSRDALVPLTQSFHLLGVLLGGILANFMMKAVSPRHTMLAGMISQILLGIATGYSETYELHLIYRCSVAATCSLMCIGIMIATDITQGKHRVITACMFEQFWSIGVILLPGVGSWWESWGEVYIAITLPTFILIFLYKWIPDSPRWLLKHGRVQEAKQVLLDAASFHQYTEFNEKELEFKLQELSTKMMKDPPEPSMFSIWRGSRNHQVQMFITHLGWSVFLMLYFAYLLHVRAMGRNYLEVNTVIAGISELLGTFIGLALILNTTRKWLWASLLNIATSLIAFSAIFIPMTVDPFTRMVLYMAKAMLNKMTVSTTLSLFITCTAELVPKEQKKVCNYSGVTCSRTLVMIAPFIGYTAIYGQLVPQEIMAVMNIAMSVLIAIFLQTPRTLPKAVKSEENDRL